jgi:hypothetical protein
LIVFKKKINKIGMLDKIIFVKLEKITIEINGDVIFTNPEDDKYLFGIHKLIDISIKFLLDFCKFKIEN